MRWPAPGFHAGEVEERMLLDDEREQVPADGAGDCPMVGPSCGS
jgi:hypothetical protein